MLLLLALVAQAQDTRAAWEQLHDALLSESAYGEVDPATGVYEELVRSLGADDPVRARALYWLGRARYSRDDVDGAREALRECVRIGIEKAPCLALLGRIELEQSSISTVPVTWTFDDTTHGFVHPWRYADKGSIRILQGPDQADGTLAWRTRVDVRGDDQLVVGFDDPKPTPRGVMFLVRSSDLDAVLRVLVYDIYDRRFVASGSQALIRLPRGELAYVDLDLGDFTGDTGKLDTTQIDRLVLQDVTASYGNAAGDNEIYLDDFHVY